MRRVWLAIGVVVLVGVVGILVIREVGFLIPESTSEQWERGIEEANEDESVLMTEASSNYAPRVHADLERLSRSWTLKRLASCDAGDHFEDDCKWAVRAASGTSQLQWDLLPDYQESVVEGYRDYINDIYLWLSELGQQELTVAAGLHFCSELGTRQVQLGQVIEDLAAWEQYYWGLEAHRTSRRLAEFETACRQDGLLP